MPLMDQGQRRDAGNKRVDRKGGIPLWFKLFALVLAGLLISKLLGLRIVVELSYDGMPFEAALTDARTYLVPLFLVFFYILLAWVWRKLSGPRDLD